MWESFAIPNCNKQSLMPQNAGTLSIIVLFIKVVFRDSFFSFKIIITDLSKTSDVRISNFQCVSSNTLNQPQKN